jgi:beta-glucosidase
MGEPLQLVIPVKNIGDRKGTEIVQVYIRKVNDPNGPIKTLKGFERVPLDPWQSLEVKIELAPNSFEFYNKEQRTMLVDSGDYEIFYGNCSDVKDLKKQTITIQ